MYYRSKVQQGDPKMILDDMQDDAVAAAPVADETPVEETAAEETHHEGEAAHEAPEAPAADVE